MHIPRASALGSCGGSCRRAGLGSNSGQGHRLAAASVGSLAGASVRHPETIGGDC